MSVAREMGVELPIARDLDPIGAQLDDILQEISPQFREIERLLDSVQTPYAQKLKMLGGAVVIALNSPDPTNSMDVFVKDFSSMCTNKRIINCAAAFLEFPPFLAKQELKRYAAKLSTM